MKIIQATQNDLSIIQQIVYDTINAIYPNYYPLEVVNFFIDHHKEENILKDIEARNVYLVHDDGIYVGTGTIEGDHINRIFILPQYQRKGYGRFIMDILEEYLSSSTNEIFVEASLPGINMYLRRGYEVVEYIEEVVADNRILFYPLMRKLV